MTLAQRLGITILGFDIAGTGESTIPLSVKCAELVLGIVKEARKEPTTTDFMAAVQQFSRRSLLDRADNSAMLVINGADDYFVPQADTLVFKGRRNTEVYLIPDIGHCGVLGGPSKMGEVIDRAVAWLPAQIGLACR